MLTIRFPPHKKVHIWFGLVWYGLVNILCWFTSLYEKISTCDGSIWGNFSSPIQQWPQISWKLYKTADLCKDLGKTLVPFDGFQHMRGQFGVVFHGQSNYELKSAVHLTTQLTHGEMLILPWFHLMVFNMWGVNFG